MLSTQNPDLPDNRASSEISNSDLQFAAGYQPHSNRRHSYAVIAHVLWAYESTDRRHAEANDSLPALTTPVGNFANLGASGILNNDKPAREPKLTTGAQTRRPVTAHNHVTEALRDLTALWATDWFASFA